MNVEHPSQQRSLRSHVAPSSTNESASGDVAMSVTDPIAALESDECDLDVRTSMDSKPISKVCLNKNMRNANISKRRTSRRLFGCETGA